MHRTRLVRPRYMTKSATACRIGADNVVSNGVSESGLSCARFTVLQVPVYCYVRNVVAASAADSARFAAAAGVDYAGGGFRATDLIG
jgi:hypothetical protein